MGIRSVFDESTIQCLQKPARHVFFEDLVLILGVRWRAIALARLKTQGLDIPWPMAHRRFFIMSGRDVSYMAIVIYGQENMQGDRVPEICLDSGVRLTQKIPYPLLV